MKTLISTIVLLACTTPVAAQGAIFADDFESGRTCWVWSRSEGSAELARSLRRDQCQQRLRRDVRPGSVPLRLVLAVR